MTFRNSQSVTKILTVAVASAAVGACALATTPAQATPPDCTGDDLSLAIGQADASAGVSRVPLTFTNISSRACVIVGFPTIQAVAVGAGIHPVGPPAEPQQERAVWSPTVFGPGESTTITFADLNGKKTEGPVMSVDELRVTLGSGGRPLAIPYIGMGVTDHAWSTIEPFHTT